PSQWNRLLDNDLRAFSLPDKRQERAFKRKFFAEATDVEPDRAGRILIPGYLKEHAGLRTSVLVQGAGSRAEIWDCRRWGAYTKANVAPAYALAGKSLEI
ncbi:MAG: cell division/cell wall cluster transcriptional repressor MraZ, partial [Elusimicrobia bacterium]|nr:cell division/cell wall cluster transcriptional repressor MraZ [Elusimicrobiota bacterium]